MPCSQLKVLAPSERKSQCPLRRTILPVQLSKAQEKFARWQSLSKGSSDRKRLEPEIEDECKSIAWQVGQQGAAVLMPEMRED